RLEAARLGGRQHGTEVVVLGDLLAGAVHPGGAGVGQAVVDRPEGVAVGPQEADEGDAVDDAPVLAGVEAANQGDGAGGGGLRRRRGRWGGGWGWAGTRASPAGTPPVRAAKGRASSHSTSGSGSRRCNRRVKASWAGALGLWSGCTRAASVQVAALGVATRKL